MRAAILIAASFVNITIGSRSMAAGELAGTPSVMSTQSAATLAPAGSFQSETASVQTRLEAFRHHAGAAKVRKLLEASIAACGEDDAGRCTKDSVTAHQLLYRASAALNKLEK